MKRISAHRPKQPGGERAACGPQAAPSRRCLGAAAQLAAVHRTLRHGPALQLQAGGAAISAQPRAAAANRTGLPDRLKAGVEELSGVSLDGVKVHYNSSKPKQLDALAYAQGGDIHLAPGQEQHLPHEAWHLVQQAQGRVRPTMQMKDGVPVNDDAGLEREADVMGRESLRLGSAERRGTRGDVPPLSSPRHMPIQCLERASVVQRVVTALQQPKTKVCWATAGYAIHLHKGGNAYAGADTTAILRAFVAAEGKNGLVSDFDNNKVADINDIIGTASNTGRFKETDTDTPFYKSALTRVLKNDAILANVNNNHYVILISSDNTNGYQLGYMDPGDGQSKLEATTNDANDNRRIKKVGNYNLSVLYFLK